MIKFFRNLRMRMLAQNRFSSYLIYAIGEIILVVIGILIAIQLNALKEESKTSEIEHNILNEIVNGLQKDLLDIDHNVFGHERALEACGYWNRLVSNQPVDVDSIEINYWGVLRTYISIQNTSSYESLKSRGLELISNDTLRLKIISLYEEDYQAIKIIEEDYQEAQYYSNYFDKMNKLVSPKFIFNETGDLISLAQPLDLDADQRNEMFSYLWKIKRNRQFALGMYENIEVKIKDLIQNIRQEQARD